MSRYILVLIISFLFCGLGCGKKKESKFILLDNNPELVSDFEIFLKQKRYLLQQALMKHRIKIDDEQKDWLEYTFYSFKNRRTNKMSTDVAVWLNCLTIVVGDIYTPDLFSLNFHRSDGKWFLNLEDGYVFDKFLGLDVDKTQGLSPEVHSAIKSIFPYHYETKLE
jgi:hypothetical protein